MDALLYLLGRTLVALLQSLPLLTVARLGRAGGEFFYWIDARHRRVALRNLERCLGGSRSHAELRRIARENFRRIGENFASAVKTASMSAAELRPFVELVGTEKILSREAGRAGTSRIIAIGHFGNFELYARAKWVPGFRRATTYRALKQPSLNRLLQSLRERSGCLFFERRKDAKALRAALDGTEMILGLLADQHAGDNGLRVPFLGQDCSSSAAPAVLALRYHCPLYTAICFRTDLARWRIEVGDEIPTLENGRARPVEAITREIHRAFEIAVLRDPANWFWVHNRWKPPKPRRPRAAGRITEGTTPVAT